MWFVSNWANGVASLTIVCVTTCSLLGRQTVVAFAVMDNANSRGETKPYTNETCFHDTRGCLFE